MEEALARMFSQTAQVTFVTAGIFARIGAAMFLLPGFGERSLPVTLRLGLAFVVAMILLPLVASLAPEVPASPSALVRVVLAEVLAGLLIGLAFRYLIFALQIVGTIAAQSISISHMFGTGVAAESEPTMASFLAYGGIVIALTAGLHVHAISALASLYALLPFGALLSGGEAAAWSLARVSETFSLALSLALPFVAVGFAYNIALGALSRAMPQLLVALIGVPLLVGLGMAVLWASLPEIFARWGEVLERIFLSPLGAFG